MSAGNKVDNILEILFKCGYLFRKYEFTFEEDGKQMIEDIVKTKSALQSLILGAVGDNFEEFLRDKHAKQYKGFDDEMVDDYEDWLTKLDYEKYIEFADQAITETKARVEEVFK